MYVFMHVCLHVRIYRYAASAEAAIKILPCKEGVHPPAWHMQLPALLKPVQIGGRFQAAAA